MSKVYRARDADQALEVLSRFLDGPHTRADLEKSGAGIFIRTLTTSEASGADAILGNEGVVAADTASGGIGHIGSRTLRRPKQ
jgi:hypothetical protein